MASFPGSGAAPATATTGIKILINLVVIWCTQCPFFRLSGGGSGHSHAGRPGLPVGAVVMAQIKIDKADRTDRAATDDRRRRLRVFLYTWLWNYEEAKKRKARERVKMFPPKEGSTIKSVFSSKRHFLSPPHAHGRGPESQAKTNGRCEECVFCTDTREL